MPISFDLLVRSALRAKKVAMQLTMTQQISESSFYTTHILFNVDGVCYDFRLKDIANSGKINVVPIIERTDAGHGDGGVSFYLGEIEYIDHSTRYFIDNDTLGLNEQYCSFNMYGANLMVGVYASDNFVEMIRVDVGPRDEVVR